MSKVDQIRYYDQRWSEFEHANNWGLTMHASANFSRGWAATTFGRTGENEPVWAYIWPQSRERHSNDKGA
jgi:hypothetical protein